MISHWTILCCICTLFLSMVLPIGALIFLFRKYPIQRLGRAWLLGAVGFFIPQMVIRTPLLQLFYGSEWFLDFSQNHSVLFVLFLAFTAAAFELSGRYAAGRALREPLPFSKALATGMGHGACESIVLVGITYINNLVIIFLINSGNLPTDGAAGAQLEALKTTLLQTPAWLFLAAGVERLLTMVCHAAFSVLVCYGLHRRRVLPCCLLCLGLHTLLDTFAGIPTLFPSLSQYAGYGLVYLLLALFALACLWLLFRLRRQWNGPVY